MARGLAIGMGIGFPFAVLVSFGALAGHYLDRRLGTSWLMVVGLLAGAVAAFLNMFRIIKHFQPDDGDAPGSSRGPGSGS